MSWCIPLQIMIPRIGVGVGDVVANPVARIIGLVYGHWVSINQYHAFTTGRQCLEGRDSLWHIYLAPLCCFIDFYTEHYYRPWIDVQSTMLSTEHYNATHRVLCHVHCCTEQYATYRVLCYVQSAMLHVLCTEQYATYRVLCYVQSTMLCTEYYAMYRILFYAQSNMPCTEHYALYCNLVLQFSIALYIAI